MTEDEKYVRARWELVHRCDGSYRHYPRGTVLIQDRHNHWLDFPDEAAARSFTEQREREIAEIEEQIALHHRLGQDIPIDDYPAHARTEALLFSRLADLRRGWKGQ